MMGIVNPKIAGKNVGVHPFFLHDSRCVPKPWDFSSSVYEYNKQFYFFSKSVFWERSYALKLRNLAWKKKRGAPLS